MVMDYINLFAAFGISYFALKIGKNFMRYIRYYSLSLSQQNICDYQHDYDSMCNYSNSNIAFGKYYTLYLIIIKMYLNNINIKVIFILLYYE